VWRGKALNIGGDNLAIIVDYGRRASAAANDLARVVHGSYFSVNINSISCGVAWPETINCKRSSITCVASPIRASIEKMITGGPRGEMPPSQLRVTTFVPAVAGISLELRHYRRPRATRTAVIEKFISLIVVVGNSQEVL
jgi:hypothetical protein